MLKRSSILVVLVALVALTSSCIFDPKQDTGGGPPPSDPWPDLSAKEDVLYTLQRAYIERKSDRYESILDQGFNFFLTDGDVNNGLPVQWDRGVERDATRNLFSKTQVRPDLPLVKSISMDVQYETGVVWVEVVNPPAAPDETWYTTTAFYYFEITVAQPGGAEDLTYLPDPNSKAQFTVRNAGTDAKPRWQLVEFRDLGAAGL
jgi:hypothetical protein